MSEEQRRTVPETNALIRALVEEETLGYPFWIGGFVAGYYQPDSGYSRFYLNSDGHSIKCIVSERVRGSLAFKLANGTEVEVFGAVSVYKKDATAQIIVEKALLIDKTPYAPDKTTIEKLEAEGLLPKMKQTLPAKIKSIGLITGRTSKAEDDFKSTYIKEGGKAYIEPNYALLQGVQAAHQIANAINKFNSEGKVDVIAIVRGGGSVEDLKIFSEYPIAKAICSSAIPIVTGIGHSGDTIYADTLADVKEITPTAAAIHLARAQEPQHPVEMQEPEQSIDQPTGRTTYIAITIGVIAIVLFLVLIALMLVK